MKTIIPFLTLLTFTLCGTNAKPEINNSNILSINKKVPPPIKTDSIRYKLEWIDTFELANTLINRVKPPKGYVRIPKKINTFPHWIRRLPLKKGNPKVMLYNHQEKGFQDAHAFVFDLDVGKKDLQQCADATMRIRAEYLYHTQKYNQIHFNYTNGALVQYSKWRAGYMPIPKDNSVVWVKNKKCNTSYKSFRAYMNQIFNYAGTHSLSKELEPVKYTDMKIGDILIYGGFPGHTVMIVDIVMNTKTKAKKYLLAQSYMPAQDFHVLKNFNNNSPWYDLDDNEIIETPEWTFYSNQLMRWN